MIWCLQSKIIFYLLILLSANLANGKHYKKCFTDSSETKVKRYPYYKNDPMTIIIDTSERITHKLSSHVFRIFVQEILGYPRVEISNYVDHFDIDRTVDRLSDNEIASMPEATLNLEVWVPPDNDTVEVESIKSVEDCGNVARPGGRFGWFIPIELTEPIRSFYKQWFDDISEVPWTIFKNTKSSSFFNIDNSDDLELIRLNSIKNSSKNEFFCNNANCHKGMYIPDQCKNTNCAILLAPDFLSTNFVIDHIEELKLYVKVVWLGDNLTKVVEHLRNKYKLEKSKKSIIFLTWTPSILVSNEEDFISVAFKKCELNNKLGCKYEMNRLVKFSWIGLKEFGKPVLEALRQYSFKDDGYDVLLKMYKKNPERSVEDIACDWMKKNNYTWLQWKLEPDSTIYIGGIFPMHNSPFVGTGIAQAAKMAENAINENKTLLNDYRLEVLMSDGQCRSDLVMKMFIDYVVNKQFQSLIGVLGPACSETVEPLASVSKHYQTMILSYSAEGSNFQDRDKYPYFFRTIGENRHYIPVFVEFFKLMNWRQVAALTEDGQKYTEYISQMQSHLEDKDITFLTNIKFTRDQDEIIMTKYLEGLKKKRARIIIADVVSEVARLIMCEAFKLKMTAKEGYVWFLPTSYNSIQGGRINCTEQEMREATNGYFSIAHSYWGEDDSIMQENITVKEWREKYKRESKFISNYAGYAYDAVWTYALATDKLAKTDPEALSNIHSNVTIRKLVEIINETDFMGVSGRIKFRGGPSRFSVINIMQWYDNKTHIIGQFHPNLSEDKPDILDGRLQMGPNKIKWFTHDHERPVDGKLPPEVCALEGLATFFNVDCSMAIVILNVIVISTVVLIVGFIIYKLKERYDKKVQANSDLIKALGFDWWQDIDTLKDLNQWEISREKVVINRKIGEGAFGHVYGGEAKFEDGWHAVAVKTLKIGSTINEKIDFLSEADIMRNFDHTNIIKLLGVIMTDEPLYTIMEFMLYGDLKTYLLARRHLAFDKTAEEVNSERLTSMALDIARGLSYLAENKFVHRDIASRNCLVNANRLVKIGDFGMCRPITLKEYYKFDRKGMLPVRWMAPESLSLGVYTTASDVWGFGVLLFEIVTFGSFPFQGLSNSEVLDAVKNGKTLAIPKGVKPQLEGLINSCWNISWKSRPHAKEIVAYIAGYKELLTPCLDAPLSSVQIENSDELEIHFPDRKCSTPTSKNVPSLSNGNIPTAFDNEIPKLKRQTSLQENSVSIPLENYCPKEPLLGPPPRISPNTNNFGKYINRQHVSNDSGVQEDDDYISCNILMNGHVAISKI